MFHNNENNSILKCRKPESLRIVSMSDTNCATNQDDRRSVTGGIHTVGGCLVSWMSKTQATTALSSCKAELMGISSNAQEVKFILMMMDEICGWHGEGEDPNPESGDRVQRPAKLLADNTGAIHFMQNQQVGQRTKHIDVRHCHVCELQESNDLNIGFIRGEFNVSDVYTKNTAVGIHDKHSNSIRHGTILANWERESVKNGLWVACVLMCVNSHRGVLAVGLHAHVNENSNSEFFC